jgi:8-oxo-dGTP pyrophosphatase MutT (NUDIX family)
MECVNCGVRGHSFRDCKEPTTSFGIVAVKTIDKVPHYLLIRRRDSLGYVDFLRGKYSLSNPEYIATLLNQMTVQERQRLINNHFDLLWINLWNAQNTRQFRSEFANARRTFELLRNIGDFKGKRMSAYIAECTTNWTEPEWGFPKGRRSMNETELQCAVREFCEETGLNESAIQIMKDEPPEIEEYVGSNNIQYKHIYYMATCNEDVYVNLGNRVQTREVGDIGWFRFEEAYLKIRNTNIDKRAVLGRIHARLYALCE